MRLNAKQATQIQLQRYFQFMEEIKTWSNERLENFYNKTTPQVTSTMFLDEIENY